MTNIADETDEASIGGSALNDRLGVKKVIAGSEAHMTLLMSKFNLNFCVGQDRKDLLQFATLVWDDATKSAREECAKVCKVAADTGDRTGVEREVHIWNLATRYCLEGINMLSN